MRSEKVCAGAVSPERAGDDWSRDCLVPEWSAPGHVRALSTTRHGGVSAAPFDTWNLADHVGDDPAAVAQNRARLARATGLPAVPRWLRQVHGCDVCTDTDSASGPTADACVTRRSGVVCAVLTADCLPVLLSARNGSAVAAVHAGWRGLAAGVLEAALARMPVASQDVLAWLGPAISARVFEVGEDVRSAFTARASGLRHAFVPAGAGRYRCDLAQAATMLLASSGVCDIGAAEACTYSDADRFYSYRRDTTTGRMATLIWIDPVPM